MPEKTRTLRLWRFDARSMGTAVHPRRDVAKEALHVRRVLSGARRELPHAVGDDQPQPAEERRREGDRDEHGKEARQPQTAAELDAQQQLDERHEHLLQRRGEHEGHEHGAQQVERAECKDDRTRAHCDCAHPLLDRLFRVR